jgi:hypothetical protein
MVVQLITAADIRAASAFVLSPPVLLPENPR